MARGVFVRIALLDVSESNTDDANGVIDRPVNPGIGHSNADTGNWGRYTSGARSADSDTASPKDTEYRVTRPRPPDNPDTRTDNLGSNPA
ncbi:MAG TPA: hypothetical protein PLY61_16985 [Anaerohalosphaeraceae bacterium]|jgi:hypothetical protein|nr:hypothetical protein [Anaerohalosphaeraceae bacterium]